MENPFKMDHLGVPGLVNVYIANWKIHPNFSWENQLFLWSFSIAMLVITRPGTPYDLGYLGKLHMCKMVKTWSK